jgi:RNA polymerase sigma-70 factor (ECF subfamily)
VASTGDPALVAALGRDDENAIRELRRRHLGALRRAVLRALPNEALAEQVAEDVLVALWQDPGRYDAARGSLRAYLLALARRRAIDVMRSEAARRRREEVAGRRHLAGHDDAEPVDERVRHRVRDALRSLDEHEAAAIHLAFFGGHTYLEVARLLGQPEGTVKTRIRSAMTALRADLADLNPRGQ